ncbi:MAG: hypothetical protein ACR2LI_13580 [Propionibacteriaceae bacterium]
MTAGSPPGSTDAAEIQDRIATARAQLLGGRGIGVAQTEIDELTRGRIVLGGEPIAQHLAAVARQTAIAGGDTAAVALDLVATRQHLEATVQATAEVIGDRFGRPRVEVPPIFALRLAWTGWAILGVVVVVLGTRARRQVRSSR